MESCPAAKDGKTRQRYNADLKWRVRGQIALVWGAVLAAGGTVTTVRFDNDHTPKLEELLPILRLKEAK